MMAEKKPDAVAT